MAATCSIAPIDYQDIIYYSAPKPKKKLNSLDEVDPELRAHLREARHLAGRAEAPDRRRRRCRLRQRLGGDDVQGQAGRAGHHLLLVLRGGAASIPSWCSKYLGSVVPYNDNFFAALNSAVFSDGSFCYIPKGVRCPMELSTYFRINATDTGQFERTLIVAEEGAYVSYLEGCTAPMRDENQLHAAVVELVAVGDDSQIKYSTVQNWYPGDKEGKGGIYNFVTKRGACRGPRLEDFVDAGGDRLGDHLEVSELHPAGRRFGRRVLLGGADEPQAAGRHRHEDDPHRQEHEEHDRLQGHLGRQRPEHLSRPGEGPEGRGERPQLLAVRFAAARRPLRGAHVPVHRGAATRRRRWSTRRPRRRSARTRSSTASSAACRRRTRST